MKERQDYVKCIAHNYGDEKNKSWCGRWIGMEFHFVGIDHAAENGLHEGRLVACPTCVDAITIALKNGT